MITNFIGPRPGKANNNLEKWKKAWSEWNAQIFLQNKFSHYVSYNEIIIKMQPEARNSSSRGHNDDNHLQLYAF